MIGFLVVCSGVLGWATAWNATGRQDLELVEEVRIGVLAGPEELSFGRISQVLGTVEGRTYVADQQVPIVRRYGPHGGYEGDVGRAGEGPGEYRSVDGLIQLSNGRLAVWDPSMARVSYFSPTGDFLDSFPVSLGGIIRGPRLTMVRFPGDQVVLRTLAAADRSSARSREAVFAWLLHDSDGSFIDSIIPPRRDLEGVLAGSRTVAGLRPAFRGETVSIPSPLGYFVEGRTTQYRITLNRPDARGGAVEIEREYETVPLLAEERAVWGEIADLFDERMGMDSPPLPREKPVFRDLHVDAEGRVWVERYVLAERKPGYVAQASVEAGWPALEWHEDAVFDLFTPAGGFLGRVRLPDRAELMYARGPWVWCITRGEFDEEYVVRYRLRGTGGAG